MSKIWIVLLFVSTVVFADHLSENEKAYVKSDQVVFSENTILIDLNDVVVEADAIYSDEQGLYFIVDQDKRDCRSPDWWCAFCKQCNAYWYSRCPKCHIWR